MSLPRLAVRLLRAPLQAQRALTHADAIVVLGSPLRPDGTLTPIGEERVVAGVALWQRGIAPLLCMTGGQSPRAHMQGVLPEADAMANRAVELGVPRAALLVERQSRFTKENATCSQAMLRAAGVRRVVIVTQPFHLRRGVLWFRRVGFEAVGWLIADSLQFADPRRELRWVLREYLALGRDYLD